MKIKNVKNNDIVIFIYFFILIAATILTKSLNNLDELWNYNFANNIAKGNLPYGDFNMVQTPLLAIVCGFILKIFGNELIVMRIIAIFLNTIIIFLVYKILELLKINKHIVYLSLTGIYFIYFDYFCLDYNFAVLLVALLSLYLEIKNLNKDGNLLRFNVKKEIVLGILVGTSILFKQTTGLFLSLIFIFYKLLMVRGKEQWKTIGKIIVTRTIGVLVPVVLLVVYLVVNNIWMEFLDYTIYGIKTFSNKISYINLLRVYELPVKILSMIVPSIIIYMYFVSVVKEIKLEEQKNIFILFAYSVACFIVTFPISDSIHFLIGSMPAIISLIYIIWIGIKKIKLKQELTVFIKEFIKAFSILAICYFIVLALTLTGIYFTNYSNFSSMKHFRFIQSGLDNKIAEIDEYILEQNSRGKKVYILDATACIYMIPLDKYNKDYDMFLKGNIGARGEEGQIEKLKNKENILILIMNENYSRNWQNPEQVRKYIIENWRKIGEISTFDIYQK